MTALENIVAPETIHRLGWTLLHFVWQAAAVALVLAILLRILQKSSANVRYIMACLALALIVLLPAITFHLISSPDLTSHGASVPIVVPTPTETLHELSDIDMPLQRSAEYMEMFGPISWTQRARNLFTPALPYIVFGWLIGVIALSVWHLGGLAQLQRLRRKMVKQVDISLQAKLNELAEALRVSRAVQLVESALVQIPTVVGWARPVILLPASALTGLTSGQLEALLAHELAHVRRHDYLVNMLQTVVEVLGFYHPAVWWVSHKIRAERENCCDDLAVSICGDTVRYAKALTEMEKLRSGHAELALAASGANLSRRISRLVGKDPVRKTRPNRASAVIAAALVIALAIPTALALSGSDSEDRPAAAVSDHTTPTTTDDVRPPAPILAETTDTLQILLDCKLFEVPTDSESFRHAGQEQLAVGSGKDLVSLLAGLIGDRNVRVLAHPQILILDGTEARMTLGADVPYIVGYEPSADGQDKPKPITKFVFDGIELHVKGETVGSKVVDLNVHLARSKPSLERQEDHWGRETQTPELVHSDSTTAITVRDGETVLIGGLKDDQRTDDTVILMITPHIIRKADTASVCTEADVVTEPMGDAKRVKPVEDPVAIPMNIGIRQALAAADKLRAAGKQRDDRREILEILSEQGYTIEAADFTGDKYTLVISKPINGNHDRKGQLVVRLTNQNDKWLIDNIDFQPAKGVKRELPRSRQQAPKPKDVGPTDTPHTQMQEQGLENLRSSLKYLAASQPDAESRHADEALLRALEYLYREDSEHAKYTLLAARSAEQGNFEEAIKYQQKAIELAKTEKHYGIGVAFQKIDSGIRVTDVVAGAPADKAGLEPGDIIKAVNGHSIKGLSQYTAAAKICGPKNSNVMLAVRSPGQDTAKRLTVKREFLLQGWLGLQEYQWRLAAYSAGKTWPEYRRTRQSMPPAQKVITVEVLELKHADCEELAELLNTILRDPTETKKDENLQPIRIEAVPGTNKLIVIGSPSDLKMVKALVTELDAPAGGKARKGPSDSVVQIFKLEYADCEEVAALLKPLVRSLQEVKIVSDANSNQLTIQASEPELNRIGKLIPQFDVPADETTLKGTISKQDQIKETFKDTETKEYRTARSAQLNVLEDQRKVLADQLQSLQEEIRLLQREYGTTDLTWRQEAKLQRIASLLNELARTESRRLQLESELLLLQQSKGVTMPPQGLLKARQEYANNDPTVKALADKIAQVEMELSLARQTFADAHPEVKKKTELLQALNGRLGELKRDLADTFDEQMTERAAEANMVNLTKTNTQLEQTKVYEHRLRETLEKEDAELIDLGRKQLKIQDLQEQLTLSKEKYNQICRRIQEFELQPKTSPTARGIGLEGVITAIDSKNCLVEISIGAAEGVKKNMKLRATRGDQFICDILIVNMDNQKAVGVPERVQQQPKVGDKVSTNS